MSMFGSQRAELASQRRQRCICHAHMCSIGVGHAPLEADFVLQVNQQFCICILGSGSVRATTVWLSILICRLQGCSELLQRPLWANRVPALVHCLKPFSALLFSSYVHNSRVDLSCGCAKVQSCCVHRLSAKAPRWHSS